MTAAETDALRLVPDAVSIVMSRQQAEIVDRVFLPANPNKLRSAHPDTIAAAHAFKKALSLAAAPAVQPAAGREAVDPLKVTLHWRQITETKALEEWRAEFGDYKAVVTLGHDNIWAYRINNTGRMHHVNAGAAMEAAQDDLRDRLSIRLHAAKATMALYAHPPAQVSGDDVARMNCFANNHGDLDDWAAWVRIRAALSQPGPASEGDGE